MSCIQHVQAAELTNAPLYGGAAGPSQSNRSKPSSRSSASADESDRLSTLVSERPSESGSKMSLNLDGSCLMFE